MVVRIWFAFLLERKNETKKWFSPVGMSVQEMTQLMSPDDKDENRSVGTVKHFPGMMTAATLCFVTEYVSFSARPQVPHASHHVADELPGSSTSQKPWCRHGCEGSWCKDTVSVVEGSQRGAASQRQHLGWSQWNLLWALAEGCLDYGGQALTSTGNYAPKCGLFPWTFSWLRASAAPETWLLLQKCLADAS